jgi:uncharacterized protein (TIGR03067 family)
MIRFTMMAVAMSLPLASRADDAAAKELKALEGKWKAVSMEAQGETLAKSTLPEFYFLVAADGKAVAKFGDKEEKASFTVDPGKSPRTIDNTHESGDHKGKKQYGIYTLDGDKWTVCMTAPGTDAKERPKDFITKGTANVTFVFERVKDK